MAPIGGVCGERNSGKGAIEWGYSVVRSRGGDFLLEPTEKVIAFTEKIKKKQTEMATAISPVSVEVDTRPLSVYDAFLRGESS